MHFNIRFATLGILFTALNGCGDTTNTNTTASGTGAGGISGSSTSSGMGGDAGLGGAAGMGGMGAAGFGGTGGTGGGCKPFYEDCTNDIDEDCDGKANTCTGDGLWAKVFGDEDLGDTAFVATDSKGNVFVATNLLGQSIDFEGGVLVGQRPDVALARLSPNGEHQWSKLFGGMGPQVLRAISDDGADGVVLVGEFEGSLDFGGGPLTTPPSETHPFIARIDGAGKQIFSRSFSGSTDYEARAVATRSDGGIVVGGCGQGTVDLGVGAPSQAGWSAFIARLSPTGQTLWARTFTSPGPYVCVEGVALDDAGNVVATGLFEDTIDFGGGSPVTSAGGYDAFMMKLDDKGNTVFRRSAGGMAAQSGTEIALDKKGDIVLTGTYQNSIDWGTGAHTTTASTSTFITKFDASGNAKWSQAFGNGGDVNPGASIVDPAGHILLTGGFHGTVDFGGETVTSHGFNDLFIAKLDDTGKLLWKKVAGDGEIQEGGTIAVDPWGNIFLGGRVSGAVDVGTGPVMSHGKDDALVAKLRP